MVTRIFSGSLPYRPPYRQWLFEEFCRRKERNPSYSLRAFAKSLGVSRTCASELIALKRHLSRKNALSVAEALALSPKEKCSLLTEISTGTQTPISLSLKEDEFRSISQWYHLAILNLAELPNHRADPKWIGQRLNISITEASQALERLGRLGYLKICKNRLIRKQKSLHSTRDVPSSAIRSYHNQNLNLAQQALEVVPLEKREYFALTLAFDLKNIQKAKKMIRRFQNNFNKAFANQNASEVYTLAIQFFPVTTQHPKMEKA